LGSVKGASWGTAGAEDDVELLAGVGGADRARRQLGARLRPTQLAVEAHLVLVARGGFEVFDADHCEVVALDPEGLLFPSEDVDLAGLVGLHPDGRLGFGEMAQQRTKDEIGHRFIFPTQRSELHHFSGLPARKFDAVRERGTGLRV
jgi:hypothetical protein